MLHTIFIILKWSLNTNNIIESGSNENGHWRKYGDGTIEQWGVKAATYRCNNAGGSGYSSGEIRIDFPIVFDGDYEANVNLFRSTAEMSFVCTEGSGDGSGFSFIVASLFNQNADRNGYFHWHAISFSYVSAM